MTSTTSALPASGTGVRAGPGPTWRRLTLPRRLLPGWSAERDLAVSRVRGPARQPVWAADAVRLSRAGVS